MNNKWTENGHKKFNLRLCIVLTELNWTAACLCSPSFPTPELEGRSNLTSLDFQIKKLRDSDLMTIKDGARRMKEEAREIKDTLSDLESWADKLETLAEEVKGEALTLVCFDFSMIICRWMEVMDQRCSLVHMLCTQLSPDQTKK